jgi:hypothetical protein
MFCYLIPERFLMRRTTFFLTAAALVVGAANLGAQTPNLAGAWTRIVDPNAPPMGPGGAPDAITITQDANAVTMILSSMGGNELTTVFKLDGTDSKKRMTDGNGNEFELVTRAKWDGSTLVVTMTRGADAPGTFAYSLDASGHLVIVATLPTPGGGKPVTHTVLYKKS